MKSQQLQAELQAELQLTNSASSVIYTNSRGHVKCLTCMWDDNQKELENLYAQTHQISPRLFKNSALPWNNHKDSNICFPEQMSEKISILVLAKIFFLQITEFTFELMIWKTWLMGKKECVCAGFAPFSCIHAARVVYSLRKLRERSCSHGYSHSGSVCHLLSTRNITISNSTIGVSIMDFHQEKCL